MTGLRIVMTPAQRAQLLQDTRALTNQVRAAQAHADQLSHARKTNLRQLRDSGMSHGQLARALNLPGHLIARILGTNNSREA